MKTLKVGTVDSMWYTFCYNSGLSIRVLASFYEFILDRTGYSPEILSENEIKKYWKLYVTTDED